MPANYIGSTYVDRILIQNYRGSVASNRYKDIWLSELKLHPELFKTVIVSYHDTRSNATHREYQIQKLFNVVKSDLFINRAYASVNGWCDTIYTQEEKAATSKKKSDAHANRTPEERASRGKKISKGLTGRKASEEHKANIAAARKGKPLSEDHLLNANAGRQNRTAEEKASSYKKTSITLINKSPEEKATTALKKAETKSNRTPEEKAATKLLYTETYANKSPEEKTTTSKKKSDAQAIRRANEKAQKTS